MDNAQRFISTLLKNGFKKVPWDKCPRGFEKANYPCFSHEEKNMWSEVYAGDSWQYMWIVGDGFKGKGYLGGKFFDDPKVLREAFSQVKLF